MRQVWRGEWLTTLRTVDWHRPRTWGGLFDPVTRGWAVILGGSLGRLALGFVASVLIARALGPNELAVFAVLAAIAMVGGAVVEFGLTEASVKRVASVWASRPDLAAARGQVFVWVRLGIAVAGFVLSVPLVLLWSPTISGNSASNGLLILALLGIMAAALSGVVSGLLQAGSRFRSLSIVMVTNSGLTAILAIALWWLGWLNLTTALVLLGVATSLASFVVGARLLPSPLNLRPPSVELLRREAPALLSFGSWLWIGNSLAMLAAQLDLVLASRWLSPATVGIYALALTLAAKAEVVNHSFYAATLPSASALRGRSQVIRYLRGSLIRGASIGLILVPVLILADPLITTIYGQEYAPAVGLFQALLGVAIFNVLTMPVLLLAFTVDQPRLLTAVHATRVITLFIACVWLIPEFGASGAVVSRLLAQITGLLLTLLVLSRLLPRFFARPSSANLD